MIDHEKFAEALSSLDVLERIASNEDNSITLLHENLGSLGEFLVLWLDDKCRVFNVSTRPHHYAMLCEALCLQRVWCRRRVADEVRPAEYNTMFD